MACSQSYFFLSLLLLFSILCINHTAMCDDEEENLLRGINNYRATLNLSALTDNDKAECLADEIADEFKNKPCTNTTGADTVPGTEPQFSDYPNLLAKCKLNVTTTRDGAILPACVPNLVQDVVLTNYTQSQYAGSLNDSKYTGIGIGSDDNWIVVILTTNTSTGGFAVGSSDSNNFGSKLSPVHPYDVLIDGTSLLDGSQLSKCIFKLFHVGLVWSLVLWSC